MSLIDVQWEIQKCQTRLTVLKEVEMLYEDGKLVDQVWKRGETSLHIACYAGITTVVQELIKMGVDLNAKTDAGDTPFHFANMNRQYKCMSLLLKAGMDQTVLCASGNTYMDIAIQEHEYLVVKKLAKYGYNINAKLKRGSYPLNCAICYADNFGTKVVQYLMARGADVNLQDAEGNTPLHLAIIKGNPEYTQMLLKAGAKATLQTINDMTPLMIAAKLSRLAIMKMLFRVPELDVNYTDGSYHCPSALYFAIDKYNEDCHKNAMHLLIKAGADYNASHGTGAHYSYLELAIYRRKHGAAERLLYLGLKMKTIKTLYNLYSNRDYRMYMLLLTYHSTISDSSNKIMSYRWLVNDDDYAVPLLARLTEVPKILAPQNQKLTLTKLCQTHLHFAKKRKDFLKTKFAEQIKPKQ